MGSIEGFRPDVALHSFFFTVWLTSVWFHEIEVFVLAYNLLCANHQQPINWKSSDGQASKRRKKTLVQSSFFAFHLVMMMQFMYVCACVRKCFDLFRLHSPPIDTFIQWKKCDARIQFFSLIYEPWGEHCYFDCVCVWWSSKYFVCVPLLTSDPPEQQKTTPPFCLIPTSRTKHNYWCRAQTVLIQLYTDPPATFVVSQQVIEKFLPLVKVDDPEHFSVLRCLDDQPIIAFTTLSALAARIMNGLLFISERK